MLIFQCHACGQKIKATEMLAGKGMRCPKCRQVVRVPHQPPHLGTTEEHLPPEEQHIGPLGATEPPPGPKLGDLSERHTYRPATPATDEGDELQVQPIAPPPLRKPSAPTVEAQPPTAAAPSVTPPAEDDPDEFQLQPLAPPPLKKPLGPPPRKGAIAAEVIESEPSPSAPADELAAKPVGPPPLKKTPPPMPGKSP